MRMGFWRGVKLLFSGRAAVLALRAWMYHWLLRKPDAFLGHLMEAGYPPDATHPCLVVMLTSEEDRAKFHRAICYAIDMALRETDAATGD